MNLAGLALSDSADTNNARELAEKAEMGATTQNILDQCESGNNDAQQLAELGITAVDISGEAMLVAVSARSRHRPESNLC